MKWLKPKHAVCFECGVHFEPYPPVFDKLRDYCKTHRGPLLAIALRKESVVKWATNNWEALEKQYLDSVKPQTPTLEQYQNLGALSQYGKALGQYLNEHALKQQEALNKARS